MNRRSDASDGCTFDAATVEGVGDAAFFEAMVCASPTPMIAMDERGTIVCVDARVAALLDRRPAHLVGRPVTSLVPPERREEYDRVVPRYLDDVRQQTEPAAVEIPVRCGDGQQVDATLAVQVRDVGGRRFFLGTLREAAADADPERDLARFATIVQAVGDGVYELDLDGRFVTVNDVVVDATGYSRDELVGEHVSKILGDDDLAKSTAVIRELLRDDGSDVGVVELDVITVDGDVLPCEDRIALIKAAGEVVGTVGVVRDISDRKRRERELERQRNELIELNQLNGVIRQINRTMVAATTREEIERSVCERLVESAAYHGAWLGTYRAGRNAVVPAATAGSAGDVEDRTVDVADSGPDAGPIAEAIRTGTVQVWTDGRRHPGGEPAAGGGDPTVSRFAAIPIAYGDTVYGVLRLAIERERAVSDREAAVLDELGEAIGLAINAVESRKLLLADTAVELEFVVRDRGSAFNRLSLSLDATIELEGVVPAAGNSYLYYVTVDGAPADAVLEAVAGMDAIAESTVVSEHDHESVLLLTVTGDSAAKSLMEAGTSISRAVAAEGESVVVATGAPDADVGAIVATLERSFPDSELVAQREVDRPVQTAREFRVAVTEQLTAKQRAVLEAAYRAGYFARPRGVSGSDLAASFGVTPSTFHYHLQTALGKVSTALFDEPPPA